MHKKIRFLVVCFFNASCPNIFKWNHVLSVLSHSNVELIFINCSQGLGVTPGVLKSENLFCL